MLIKTQPNVNHKSSFIQEVKTRPANIKFETDSEWTRKSTMTMTLSGATRHGLVSEVHR